MARYEKGESRAWAVQNLRGVANVIIPTFTRDLSALNEEAVRFDVRREIELGFIGALAVAETATTVDEYVEFVRWISEEGRGSFVPIFHASFNTVDENIRLACECEDAGAELVLLSYPPTFYPATEEDIFQYTKTFCDATNLGVILFPVPLWGFERLHPASIRIDLLERMVDNIPNVVAIKAEGGHPSLGGFTEAWNRLGERVVVTMPLEHQAIPLATLLPLQLIATSNTESMGDCVPRMLSMCHEKDFDKAMELFWRCDPIRRASERIGAIGGSNSVHRMAWKYQAWLAGFNGGPLRQPTSRLVSSQMNMLRQAASVSGVLFDETDADDAFFVGRNPH